MLLWWKSPNDDEYGFINGVDYIMKIPFVKGEKKYLRFYEKIYILIKRENS